MNSNDLKIRLEESFEKQHISSRVLLSGFRFLDESSRKTAAYQDNRYVPFFYHLGKFVQPKTLLEIGYSLGTVSGCFFKSCKSVEKFLAFQPKTDEYYSPRLGRANTRDVFKGDFKFYYGDFTDSEFINLCSRDEWDLVLINEETQYDKQRNHLDIIWEHVGLEGYVVMDYIATWQPAKDAFFDFCKIKNREPMVFKTRYGTGIVQK